MDQEIDIEKLKTRDESETRRLFDLLVPKLQAWVRRGSIRIDPLDADDTVQEALLSIYRHIDRYSGPTDSNAFFLWCYRIVRNVTIDQFRRCRAREQRNALCESAPVEPKTPRDTETVEAEEAKRTLERAMAQLSESERRLISMHFLDDLSLSDIATRLTMSSNAVHQMLRRAILKLRQSIPENRQLG